MDGFNSMIVRLKDTPFYLQIVILSGFNSMIVRLKAIDKRDIPMYQSEFQFYDSPIKRLASRWRASRKEIVSIL